MISQALFALDYVPVGSLHFAQCGSASLYSLPNSLQWVRWGLCSWSHIRAKYPGWDTWSALHRTPRVSKVVLSWYCCCYLTSSYAECIGVLSWWDISLQRHATREPKINSGSCRWICGKLRVGRSSLNDITYFSHGCYDVGCLIETALLVLLGIPRRQSFH